MNCPFSNKPCCKNKIFQFFTNEDNKIKVFDICQDCFLDFQIKDHVFSSCSTCGSTMLDIEKEKMFGCSNCYVHFATEAYKMIEKCQVGMTHCGKKPNLLVNLTLDQLQLAIKRCIETENYELASLCKKAIEQKSKKQNL